MISDLFLPRDFAAEVGAGLALPALEKLLARGHGETLPAEPLENLLCERFGVPCQADVPIAPIAAAFDGLPMGDPAGGGWLRADPTHLRLQREQLVLLPNVEVGADEAAQFCASLNEHFGAQGLAFFAPHPQRWYVRLDSLPDIETVPLSQAAGRNVHGLLPKGGDATRWHQVFNEIQMLLFAHPLNEARETRGALPVNSVWFWGGGCDTLLAKPAVCGNRRQAAHTVSREDAVASRGGGCDDALAQLQNAYDSVHSDEVLVEMFATAAGIPFAEWPAQWRTEVNEGKQLLVWTGLRAALQRGDLGAWRAALQDFEHDYAQPLWQALREGKIAQLQIDIVGGESIRQVRLTRGDAWAFWRRAKRLADYSSM